MKPNPLVPALLVAFSLSVAHTADIRRISLEGKEAKVPCDFTKTEHGGHGFGLKPVLPPDVKDWPDRLHAFLDGVK
jgi:hypothetical protein